MDIGEIISAARSAGRAFLTEKESKQVLKAYGVPVVEEAVVTAPPDALEKARQFGFPVVVKGHGFLLTHKTERGLVHTGIGNDTELLAALHAIQAAAENDLEGYLVQPQISGNREFVAGLFRDRQFGPVVMFGIGGILTEALQDVAFRIGPVTRKEALDAIDEIKAQSLLGAFRGQQEVDRETMVRVLEGLSRLADDFPEIREVDINPLIADADGRLTAVDALVALGDPELPVSKRPPVDPKAIYKLFHPRSVAFVGASATFGKWGHMLFTNVVGGGYQGDIYLVNARGGEIAGRPVYKTVTDIPGPVDLGIVTLPADKVAAIIPEFQQKGIRQMLLITSGFSETGEEGRKREEELVRLAREAGILILGPNTMGIINPHIHFSCTGTHIRPKPGTTTLLAQSGNLGTQLLVFAVDEGLGIRGFCGSGNEAMVTIEDYLEGFIIDEETENVLMYLESIKDGRRFYETAKRLCRKKPVVVLKGGRSESGNRAAASHTGAMASNMKVFDAACRQAGVVVVEHPMELLDLSAVFSSLPLPRGNRVAAMTIGGGWGVVMADLCEKHGLQVPQLSPELIAKIDGILPPYWSRSNPIDLVAEFDPAIPMMITEELMQWDGCDAVVHMGILGRMSFFRWLMDSAVKADPNHDRGLFAAIPDEIQEFEERFIRHLVTLMERYGKPILGVTLLLDENTKTVVEVPGHKYKSVSFLTPERTVKSLAEMYNYRCWLNRQDN
ncbi:MAG: acetate--CoA ligase family protein [Syntrophaceae bacterium]|nr:acetate--CoA ligase family protein [Syntrophaceae bacterium]